MFPFDANAKIIMPTIVGQRMRTRDKRFTFSDGGAINSVFGPKCNGGVQWVFRYFPVDRQLSYVS